MLLLVLRSHVLCQLEEFISIDCGGTSNYTDKGTGLSWISDSGMMKHGKSVLVQNPRENKVQYQRRRDFPIDSRKYCYTLGSEQRRRYLVRATFQYGILDDGDTYPQFQLYLDATKWATVSIYDATRTYVKEMIFRAPSNSIDVCVCCATTGSPFISTLELRPLNLSMYATDFESSFFLKVAARINFGAPSEDVVRSGTERINTTKKIEIETREYPPVKVMQTAVVGTKGVLSYRLNLEDFPGNARAYAYFAEIEDLAKNETRKFKLEQPYIADYSNAVVNIAENANGTYTLYEPSYMNVSLEFVLSFSFVKTRDSTQGPLLNAMEISKYVQIASKTDRQDSGSALMNEGDPCVPTPWDWINCSTTTPPRITKIFDDNPELHKGSKKHFQLMLGISIGVLGILLILFLASLVLLLNLRRKTSRQKRDEKGISGRSSTKPLTGYSFGRGGNLMDEGTACYITLSELKEATNNFSKKIGKGSFGSVYYGKMSDGKEVAVKTMTDLSSYGNQQFVNEVALLSRIHHRNLVPLIGYCEEEYQHMLVYEYMHNGTLREYIHGLIPHPECSNQKQLDWLSRLRIAEDAARGLEYLHTGCNPSIIHRDVKTSNILLDINMRAKVSDFGLSRLAEEDLTHISSVARGTVGYLDPEYYANQQLTEKSDVYSFGVVLLELISGKKPVSSEDYGPEMNIVHWVRSLIRKGDVMSIMDPSLVGNAKTESIWRVAEIAMQCVEQHGAYRPKMQEVILAIQDASSIEKGTENQLKLSSSSCSKPQSSRKTLLASFLEIESPDLSNSCLPSAR
ncbi:hypothetical protein V8G54_021715 [Vigna mungo]|uniref:Protein kinase domain-containing protein n=1 Tax=Vigna mungo TaxID=3915 RepID=A0AAQ3NDX6_VIGMU